MRRKILASSALLFTLSLAAPVQAVNSAQPRLLLAGHERQEWGGSSPSRRAQRRDEQEVYDAINEIYRDVLDRDADYSGLRNWARKLERGATLRDIREDIARSREAQDRIRDIYREVLDRQADAGGIRTWVGELADGDSLSDVRKKIAGSQEAENAINRIYRQVLGRNADRDGLRTWKRKLQDGATLSEIRERIAGSDEARQRRGRQRR